MATLPSSLLNLFPASQAQPRPRADDFEPRGSLEAALILGRKELRMALLASPPQTLKPGELMATDASYKAGIYRLREGWTSRSQDMFKNRTVITDVYLPGDVMGLDTLIQPKWQENIVALTFATVEVFSAEGKLLDLMANASLALYVFWLLAQRQRRIERHLAVNTRLEAEARVAVMLLDLYVRLRRKKLIATPTYHLPMTQTQIGDYLGLSAVHVNRVLGLLRTEQVINLEKNCVTILNLERLKALAHEAGLANSAPKSEVSAAELSCSAP